MKKICVIVMTVFMFVVPLLSINYTYKEDMSNAEEIVNKLENLLTNEANTDIGQAKTRSRSVNVDDNRLTIEEVIYMATAEMNSATDVKDYYKAEKALKVTDFSDNEYLFISFKPCGSTVIALQNYTTVETNFFDETDYSYSLEERDYKYIPFAGIYEFDGETYSNRQTAHAFSKENAYMAEENSAYYADSMKETFSESIARKITTLSDSGGGSSGGRKDWDVNVLERVVNADVEVPHAWYFKHNRYRFSCYSGGKAGICEYIAMLLMASYHDFFSCAGYFSDEEISKYVYTMRGTTFEEAIPVLDDIWCLDLYRNFGRDSLTAGDLNDLLKSFMSGKSVNYDRTSAYWLFGNPKDVIGNKKRPDMLCGYLPNPEKDGTMAHNVVAYGYFTSGTYNGKYLTHYGWNERSQCIIDREFFKTGYDWSIINKSAHVHRYIFNVNGELKCGCEY